MLALVCGRFVTPSRPPPHGKFANKVLRAGYIPLQASLSAHRPATSARRMEKLDSGNGVLKRGYGRKRVH